MILKNNPLCKKSLALALTVALVAMMVAPAFAVEGLYLENSILNDSKDLQVWLRGWGFAFTGNGEYLSRVIVYAHNTTTVASVAVRGYLYNCSASEPNPTIPIDYTAQVTVNPTTQTAYEFDFGSDVDLVNGENYFFGVVVNGTATGTLRWEASEGSGQYLSDGEDGWDDDWSYYGALLCYQLYTDDELGGGTPYTPPGTYDPTTYDTIISSFVAFIVPLLVMLLPAFLLCFIAKRVDKWLILLGLAIGAGLGYYFNMVPLWLVFLVTIGLIGMAYQSVRGGGNS